MGKIYWKCLSVTRIAGILAVSLLGSGCVTKRTTTSGGHVEKKYVVKRPVKNFIKNVEFD
ncbi:MAG: hypothetical protein P1U90_07850 [Akkermansiaceae bacterium]|jgi:hypothetical protein|nr:hypothetical protein [Akkermansiaceae bacterium]